MATLDAVTIANKIAAHNLGQATAGVSGAPFSINSGDIIPPTIDMSYANLAAYNGNVATFTGGVVTGVAFKGTILTGAAFKTVTAQNCDFDMAKLTSANCATTDFTRSQFNAVNMVGANLTAANLTQVDLRNTTRGSNTVSAATVL